MSLLSGSELDPATSRNPSATSIPTGGLENPANQTPVPAVTVRQPTAQGTVTPQTNTAPPKASSIKGAKSYVGLCDAMNSYEKSLVAAGIVEYPNQYSIQFVPAGKLANATISPKGTKELSTTSQPAPKVASDQVVPAKTSVDINSKRFSILAGQQIIQQIGLILQNSSYISDQQKAILDPTKVEKSATPQSASTTTTDWFRVSVHAVPIGNKIDKKRNDYPYKITYIVTTYAINQMQSQYFNDAKFRGIHKAYNYWFTGLNTQVLRYEQSYNNQFFYVMGSKDKRQGPQSSYQPDPLNDYLAQGLGAPAAVASPPTGTVQGSTNDANTPSATAVDYLYSMGDQGVVKINIVGDPAWLLQGEVKGITANSVTFDGFYPDGSVCYETQEVIFSISFNAPTDYNSAPGAGGPAYGTGTMDTMSAGSQINGVSSTTTASAAYRATTIKSIFSKGSFTQELSGTALTNLNPKQISSALVGNGRSGGIGGGGLGSVRSAGGGAGSNNSISQDAPTNASTATPEATAQAVTDFEGGLQPDTESNIPTISINPGNQTATAPGPVTSNGEDVTETIYSGDPRVGAPVSADQMSAFLGVNTGAAASTGADFGVRTPTSAASSEFYTADDIRARRLARWAAEDATSANRPVMAARDDAGGRIGN